MNKKITLYELLGLVKDGQAPKKIKTNEFIYGYLADYEWYFYKPEGRSYDVALGGVSGEINLLMNAFNKNIEILEEEKKIEKIDLSRSDGNISIISKENTIIQDKINEIIDEINSHLSK